MVTKKKKGLAQLIRYWLLQIELVTCMYVMDPTEKALFLAVVFFILSLVFYWAWPLLHGVVAVMASLIGGVQDNHFENSL